MNHYLEIAVLPDPEFTASTLMSVLFSQLHSVLVAENGGMVGVSFPEVDQSKPSLGSRLRLHGTANELERLLETEWLAAMRDYVRVSKVSIVPSVAQHIVVRRVQVKSSPERLRRRLIKRKGISEKEARMAIPDNSAKMLNLPFVSLKSKSTGQFFRLFIDHCNIRENPVAGTFSKYGLSSTATVPWF